MRHNFVEAFIGAVVLAAAGFFFVFVYSASQKNIADGYMVYARFERIDGINVGSDVKMSGVKIGVVHHLEIDPKTYQARITLNLSQHLQLPKDSSAEIASESLLGGKYVALVPGGSEQFLTSGEEITHTQSSISFEGLISKFLFSQSGDNKHDAKATA
ncbi:outer membrane lipid asymmetry maintenance protein MlaD [Candidatus Finniella inopinata]|uniref:Outer membrane lipid asymmetry maintenance protein MlaD n=1 Tax=Candidatus Finniella inopinata TaxID=1696036 RepID=A0A4Q7DNG7_9PROT|nr:outer membrane lipid asymmetry maintenance protein MlaD [Candidatus Finniella inopinata]RZI46416.1 outer membrane lipid asymmetry maintenance protein MlaD [Candidatus Finniella inopinata]